MCSPVFFFFPLCSIQNHKNEGCLYFWLSKSNVSHACITRSCFSVCQKGLATLEMLSGDFSLKKIQFSSVTNTRLYQTLGYEKHSVISNTWLKQTMFYECLEKCQKVSRIIWMAPMSTGYPLINELLDFYHQYLQNIKTCINFGHLAIIITYTQPFPLKYIFT